MNAPSITYTPYQYAHPSHTHPSLAHPSPLPHTHTQGAASSARAATGQFPRLPIVPPAHELITTAIKRAERVAVPKTVKNEAQRAKARTARLLDTLTKEVSVPLGVLIRGFPPPHVLHPFETALLQLTVGEERYVRTLARVNALRKSVLEVWWLCFSFERGFLREAPLTHTHMPP